FDAEAGHRHDADAVAVLFTKQRHGSARDRFLGILHVGVNRRVAQALLVHDPLDLENLLTRQRREMDEIETQAIWCDERSGLLDVTAQHLPECRMQKVRGGVMPPRGVADVGGHLRSDKVARVDHAADDLHSVQPWPCADAEDTGDLRLAMRRADRSDVRDLAAGLEIKRRLRKRDEAVLTGSEAVNG